MMREPLSKTEIQEFSGLDHKRRVLVVDDVSFSRDIVQAILCANGHRVDVASDGHEAAALVRSMRYDVVLMDLQMPDDDGYVATALIRNLPDDRRHVPIVALTGLRDAGTRERCHLLGMDGFIEKPFPPHRLLDEVVRWTGISWRSAKASSTVWDRDTYQTYMFGLSGPRIYAIYESFYGLLLSMRGQAQDQAMCVSRMKDEAHKIEFSALALGYLALYNVLRGIRTLSDPELLDVLSARLSEAIELALGHIVQRFDQRPAMI